MPLCQLCVSRAWILVQWRYRWRGVVPDRRVLYKVKPVDEHPNIFKLGCTCYQTGGGCSFPTRWEGGRRYKDPTYQEDNPVRALAQITIFRTILILWTFLSVSCWQAGKTHSGVPCFEGGSTRDVYKVPVIQGARSSFVS